MTTIVPWCTRDDLIGRMGDKSGDTGLSAEKIDMYATLASEVMWALSGRQFGGVQSRTVLTEIGRRRGLTAPALLSRWWPVTSVTNVVVVPGVGDPVPLDPVDWSWNGGTVLTVPSRYANQRAQALIDHGQAPTAAGINAAAALGYELMLADPEWDGDGETRLPALVTSVSRQGVSQSFATVLDVVKEGSTGIAEVDQFVMTYNRTRTRQRPRVRVIR